MRDRLSTIEFQTSENPEEILVFISGFPDNETSGWGNFLERMKKRPNLKIICMCLPDLEDDAEHRPWGYTFNEIILLINATVNHHVPDRAKKVNLIIHDWGSFFGFLYENRYPERVKSITSLDVGIIRMPKTLTGIFIVILYQWWFAVAYAASQLFGLSVANLILAGFVYLVPSSLKVAKSFPRAKDKVNATMMYPYYHFWKSYFFDKKNLLQPKHPACPVLYMYGLKKPVMFHADSFLLKLDHDARCRQLAMQTGHWVAEEAPEQVEAEVIQFLRLQG